MKDAFTMIEVIFVIVVIGILMAVAIPRLSTTRDDAINASLTANAKICVDDLVSAYTATKREPVINDYKSCVKVNEVLSDAIRLNDPNIIVTGVSSVINGQHRYKGFAININ
jgi:prepilin-type N-terminal cleavage/methylation domain-containing protein